MTHGNDNASDTYDVLISGYSLLTAKQLAAALTISEKTVYAYVSKGLIPFIKIQSNVRFRPQAIRDWLQGKEFLPSELRRRSNTGRAA